MYSTGTWRRFWISRRFLSIRGRRRSAPARPSRWAFRVDVEAVTIRRESWPARTNGRKPGTSAAGRFFTSRHRLLRVPSRVEVALRLPKVALPMW
jgi:hypothetical protein